MEKYRFLLSGSGGQGIITLSILLAEAAVLYEGLNAVQSQMYGPQARGGATRADVIISDSPIFFPKVLQPNILVALTDDAAAKYLNMIRPGGICLYDPDLLKPNVRVDARFKAIPMHEAVREKIGKSVVYNICVLGALATLTKTVTLKSLEKTLAGRFRKEQLPDNLKALRLGAELAAPLVDEA